MMVVVLVQVMTENLEVGEGLVPLVLYLLKTIMVVLEVQVQVLMYPLTFAFESNSDHLAGVTSQSSGTFPVSV